MADKPTIKPVKVFSSEEEFQEYLDSSDTLHVDSFADLPEFVQEAIREALTNNQVKMDLDEKSAQTMKDAGVTPEELIANLRKSAGLDN